MGAPAGLEPGRHRLLRCPGERAPDFREKRCHGMEGRMEPGEAGPDVHTRLCRERRVLEATIVSDLLLSAAQGTGPHVGCVAIGFFNPFDDRFEQEDVTILILAVI